MDISGYTERQQALLRVMRATHAEYLTPFGERCIRDEQLLDWAVAVEDWYAEVNADPFRFSNPNEVLRTMPPPEGIVFGHNGRVEILSINGPARMRRLLAAHKGAETRKANKARKDAA